MFLQLRSKSTAKIWDNKVAAKPTASIWWGWMTAANDKSFTIELVDRDNVVVGWLMPVRPFNAANTYVSRYLHADCLFSYFQHFIRARCRRRLQWSRWSNQVYDRYFYTSTDASYEWVCVHVYYEDCLVKITICKMNKNIHVSSVYYFVDHLLCSKHIPNNECYRRVDCRTIRNSNEKKRKMPP